jgi:sarcosine oxidase gamma subunit
VAEIEQSRLWAELPDLESRRLMMGETEILKATVAAQFLISGALGKAATSAGVDQTGVGAFGQTSGAHYSVRIARDRLLVVSNAEIDLVPGWHQDGYAVTDMTGALTVFEISGRNAVDIVKRATDVPLEPPSPSAAVIFAGVSVLLYRHVSKTTIRIHVDCGLAPYLWQWFEMTVTQAPK